MYTDTLAFLSSYAYLRVGGGSGKAGALRRSPPGCAGRRGSLRRRSPEVRTPLEGAFGSPARRTRAYLPISSKTTPSSSGASTATGLPVFRLNAKAQPPPSASFRKSCGRPSGRTSATSHLSEMARRSPGWQTRPDGSAPCDGAARATSCTCDRSDEDSPRRRVAAAAATWIFRGLLRGAAAAATWIFCGLLRGAAAAATRIFRGLLRGDAFARATEVGATVFDECRSVGMLMTSSRRPYQARTDGPSMPLGRRAPGRIA